MTVEEKRRCLLLVNHYGIETQEKMAIGECAELIVALRHKARGRATNDDVIDEIADVIIMTQQLSFIYGQRNVDNRITEKLDRQIERIKNEKPKTQPDVVKVIRCRDCKFYDDGKYCCCTRLDMWTHEKDYCSRAERREAD